jgi:hypothetical protein
MYSQPPSISASRSSIRNLRTRHAVVTGSDLSWWQGPTYRGDRDRLIVVTGTDLSWWQGQTYRGDRDRLIVVTGTDLSWWQGQTYRGDRDRLIVVTRTDLSWWQGPTYRGDRDRLIVGYILTTVHIGADKTRYVGNTKHTSRYISVRSTLHPSKQLCRGQTALSYALGVTWCRLLTNRNS